MWDLDQVTQWRSEKNDGDGVKDIEKAADAFASRVGANSGGGGDKIHRGKGNGSFPKDKTSHAKGKSKGDSIGNNGKLKMDGKKAGKGSNNGVSAGKTGGKTAGNDGKKCT